MNKSHHFNKYHKRVPAKAVNLKYLYEVVAIPKDVRERYLDKLTAKLNSYQQKNVKLLKIVYRHLEVDKKLLWDDRKICGQLGITKEMLYCHKSRLLKGLREFYFGWEEIEKKEFIEKKDSLLVRHEKAKKMFELGMQRESKSLFNKIEKEINQLSRRKTVEERLILFNTLHYLCSYYFGHKRRRKFLQYYNAAMTTGMRLLKLRDISCDEKTSNLISIDMNNLKSNILLYDLSQTTNFNTVIELNKDTIKKSMLFNDKKTGRRFIRLAEMYLFVSNKIAAIETIKEGIKFCKKNNDRYSEIVLRSFLLLSKLANSVHTLDKRVKKYFKLYTQLMNLHSKEECILMNRFLLNGKILTSRLNDNRYQQQIAHEFAKHNLIVHGFYATFETVINMKFVHYYGNIYIKEKIHCAAIEQNYIAVTGIDNEYLKKYNNALLELQILFHRVNTMYAKKNAYIFMLLGELFKGKECNRGYTDHLFSEIKYLDKTRPEIAKFNKGAIDVLNLFISILCDSVFFSKTDLWHKYEDKINKLVAEIKMSANNKGNADTAGYLSFSFIAEQTGSSKMKSEVRKLYHYIIERQPTAFDHVIRNLENKAKSLKPEMSELIGKLTTKAA
jgi:hypothetical protein